ncbi:hypothetical protein ACLMJK_000370 [Lecanora helva]
MTLLDNHFEQIALSSAAIRELPFPPPKVFTNSLLHSHDITALIRDTEPHERALFTLETEKQHVGASSADPSRRNTVYGVNSTTLSHGNGNGFRRDLRQGSAVATLLGGEFSEQLQKANSKEGKERGEVDVNLLLKGAEKLCGVYPIPGAPERIASLRSRYEQLNSSIGRYESKIAKQMIQLEKMNKHKDGKGGFDDLDDPDFDEDANGDQATKYHITEEDLMKEDEDIRELEEKKRKLEDRVSGMERDLGGLNR